MNRLFKRFFLFLVFVGFSLSSIAQIKEGKVIYNVTFPDANIPEEQKAMLPTESTVWFKNDKARIELEMGTGIDMVLIVDKKDITMLMDFMGNKIAFKDNDSKKENTESYKVLDDTKEIAGYNCRKSVLNSTEGDPFVVWYTDDISANKHWNGILNGVPGFPMEFTMKTQQLNMYMLAMNVNAQKVEDALFKVPDDYKMMTEKELKKMFGGVD